MLSFIFFNSIINLISVIYSLILISILYTPLSTLLDVSNGNVNSLFVFLENVFAFFISSVQSVTSFKFPVTSNTFSIQFSLATLYFTLFLTGSVIFSLSEVYTKRKEKVARAFTENSNTYITWFNDNENQVSLNIKDYCDERKVTTFCKKVSDLRESLRINEVNEPIYFTKLYNIALLLLITIFFTGIDTLLIAYDNFTVFFLHIYYSYIFHFCGFIFDF